MKRNLAVFFFLLTAAASMYAHAHGKHVHGRHVHGEAEMNVVLQDSELLIEIQSPLANLTGFEHRPLNRQQAAAVENMKAVMKDADRVFGLTPDALCAVRSVTLESAVFDEKSISDKGAGKEDGHNSLSAQYLFACENPARLRSMAVHLFALFDGMHVIKVQAVSKGRQKAAALDAQRPTFSFE